MKTDNLNATELEAELVRLNALVRERREQLARLEDCPNQACPCRVVWREVVEKNLATQVRKVRHNVRTGRNSSAKVKRRPVKSK